MLKDLPTLVEGWTAQDNELSDFKQKGLSPLKSLKGKQPSRNLRLSTSTSATNIRKASINFKISLCSSLVVQNPQKKKSVLKPTSYLLLVNILPKKRIQNFRVVGNVALRLSSLHIRRAR